MLFGCVNRCQQLAHTCKHFVLKVSFRKDIILADDLCHIMYYVIWMRYLIYMRLKTLRFLACTEQ